MILDREVEASRPADAAGVAEVSQEALRRDGHARGAKAVFAGSVLASRTR
jgi:hypothetical protein